MANSNESSNWLIYGANGYTGALIAEEAVRRGLRPRLGGRNRGAVTELASRLGTSPAVCDVGDEGALRAAVAECRVVLNCAGPFSATSRPVLDACLAEGAHYLDVTGEIDVFEACHSRSREGVARGISIVPGVGFDVVPTDCVAARLKESLPEASALVLGFEASGGPSVGTAKTGVEGLARGGRIRRGGALVSVPLGFKTRTFMRGDVARLAMTIPWGDVFTAWVTTAIPDIEVYMAVSPSAVASVRRLNWVRPLLRLKPLTRFLQSRVAASVRAPSAEKRARTSCYIWGEATAPDGRVKWMEIETPNGYALTVTAALGVVQRLMKTSEPPAPGYLTPSQLMGSGYVFSLPGVSLKADR